MKKGHNRGSATIEMTLLVPVFLGIFYLYICLFLFMIESSRDMEQMVKALYSTEENDSSHTSEIVSVTKQGDTSYVAIKDSSGMFDMDLKFCCHQDLEVKNIRRWQFVFDTLRKGENE